MLPPLVAGADVCITGAGDGASGEQAPHRRGTHSKEMQGGAAGVLGLHACRRATLGVLVESGMVVRGRKR